MIDSLERRIIIIIVIIRSSLDKKIAHIITFSSLGFSREEASLDWDKYVPFPRSIELMLFSRAVLCYRSGHHHFPANYLFPPSVAFCFTYVLPVISRRNRYHGYLRRWTAPSFFTDRITYVRNTRAGWRPTRNTRGMPARNDFLKNQPRGCPVSTLGYWSGKDWWKALLDTYGYLFFDTFVISLCDRRVRWQIFQFFVHFRWLWFVISIILIKVRLKRE